MTIIMATHDIEEIKDIKPRIIYLATSLKYDGKYDG
jgi:ABC-type Mn2+/Zn2+ transport system ATPase subunit